MSDTPTPDAITAADPRVARILALIRQQSQPVPTQATPDQSMLPQVQTPPVPTQIGGPTLTQQMPVNLGAPPVPQQLPQAPPPQLSQPAQPDVTQAPQPPASQPGPIKSFLQHLVSGLGTDVYAGSQGALSKLGLPTDYDRQQNAAKLALQQQQQDSLEGLRQTQADQNSQRTLGMQAQLAPFQIPDDEKYGPFRGQTLPTSAATAIMQKYEALQNAKDIAAGKVTGAQGIADTKAANALAVEQLKQSGGNPRDHVLRSVNGQIGLYSKRDGSLVKSLGADTSTITPVIRAKANAEYARAQVSDDQGNPTTVSGLEQLRTGAPTMTEKATQTLAGDKLGTATYLAANKIVRNNIGVLRDPTQKAIIARATEDVERNPGAIDSVINSALQEGLSPQGAQLISAMKQMNEFGSTFKKYTGNGGSSTDSLRATIHSNQPSTANSEAVNLNLLGQDERLATGVLQNLGKPGKYTVPSKGSAAPPSSAPANGGHPSFFHPLNQ